MRTPGRSRFSHYEPPQRKKLLSGKVPEALENIVEQGLAMG
jgi:hypothetical protein